MSSSLMRASILVLSVVSTLAQTAQPSTYPKRPRPNMDFLGLLFLLAIPGVIGIAAIFFINWGFVCNNPSCGPPIVGTGPCSSVACQNAIPCAYDGSCSMDPLCRSADKGGPTCDCSKGGDDSVIQSQSGTGVSMTPSLYVAEV